MKTCKGLSFAALLAIALALLAVDSDAQQGYCPFSSKYVTLTKQQQTTSYYQNLQLQQQTAYYQQLQQQAQTMTAIQRLQSTPTTTKTKMPAPIPQQQHQQAVSKTPTAANVSTGICHKTTPQLPTAKDTTSNTAANQPVATAIQCSYKQSQTSTTSGQIPTPVQKTTTPVQKTALAVQTTPITKTSTTTETKLLVATSCNQCHQPAQQPGPSFPQVVQQRLPQYPMPVPDKTPLVPQVVALPGGTWPTSVGMKPSDPPAPVLSRSYKGMPQPSPEMARLPLGIGVVPSPTLKYMDLQTILRVSDPQFITPRFDPLVVTAPRKKPVGADRLPALAIDLSPEPILRASTRTMNGDLTGPLPLETKAPGRPEVDAFSYPLSEEDLQQPPARQLAAGVIQLPLRVTVPETWMTQDELVPPLLPSVEPLLNRDPLEPLGGGVQPTSTLGQPQASPPLLQPGLPAERQTDLGAS